MQIQFKEAPFGAGAVLSKTANYVQWKGLLFIDLFGPTLASSAV